jgi:uncharacterized protein YcbX
MRVGSMHLYPIKSCGGISVQSADVMPRGLSFEGIRDRSWFLIDEAGSHISQREHPKLASVRVALSPQSDKPGILVTAPDKPPLQLYAKAEGEKIDGATVHGSPVTGHIAAIRANAWFSDFLGKNVRLLFQEADDRRACDPRFAADPERDETGYADGFPYLVVNSATLDRLNGKMAVAIPMNRFRPNIVITSAAADAEYGWLEIDAGQSSFALVKPCARCVMTTIDQETGIKTGTEPLATLTQDSLMAQKFAGGGKVQGVIFGQNAVPEKLGRLSVGDAVIVCALRSEEQKYQFRARKEPPKPLPASSS